MAQNLAQRTLVPAEITYVTRTVESHESATVSFYEDMFWVESPGLVGVQVFPIGESQFIVHQETSSAISVQPNIIQALQQALEELTTS